MKLLFNNTREIITFLPSIDADITFARLELDIKLSTESVIKIIGQEMYDHIANLDINDQSSAENIKLVEVLKLPIITDAYRQYNISNDLSHTNDGRRIRLNDQEKIPFEWQIDRDNKQAEKRYYKALDRLIEYLDKINPNNWKSSEEYKNSFTTLFRTTEEFNEYFQIESRYLLMKLTPGIKKCIKQEIIPRISDQSWKDLLLKLQNNNSSIDNKLVDLIKAATSSYSLWWGLMRLSAQLFPEGILQNYVSDSKTSQAMKVPQKTEVGATAKSFENDYRNYLIEIENHVRPEISEVADLNLDEFIKDVPGGKIVTM